MVDRPLTLADLERFTESESVTEHPQFADYSYSEGVAYVAERANAQWLIDAILTHQSDAAVRAVVFQSWMLSKEAGGWELSMVDVDNDSGVLIEQRIDYCDFPLGQIRLWLTDFVLMLPAEY
jgi:hypothetical protein